MLSPAVVPKMTPPLILALQTLTIPLIDARSPLVLVLEGSYLPFVLRLVNAELKLSLPMLLPLRSIPALAPAATEKSGALVVLTRMTRGRVAERAGTVT